MDALLLLARLLLAGVFILSAVTKLRDPDGTRRAVAGFGVPERYALPGAIALPIGELTFALLLIPTPTAWWGALGTLLLLCAFIGGIVYNLRQGRKPDCHCFGQLHSEPIGASTLVRNGLLSATALFILLFGWGDPGASTISWFRNFTNWERVLTVAAALLVVAVAAEAWLLYQMVRQNGRLLLRLDSIDSRLAGVDVPPVEFIAEEPPVPEMGLPVGSPAPAFSLDGIYGDSRSLDELLVPGNPALLIFTTPTCGPCGALMPDIGRWQREYSDRLTLAIIGQGEPAANRAKSAEHGLTNFLLQKKAEVSVLYDAMATPTAVLVNTDGTIGSPATPGADAIRKLVEQLAAARPEAMVPTQAELVAAHVSTGTNGSHAGTIEAYEEESPAESEPSHHPFELPDLEGTIVSLDEFKGDPTILLFWNPGCGYCQRMLDDLKAWEENPPPDSPRLVIVSTGSVEANQEQGLKSRMVLDENFETGNSYGVGGTPSAVLLDEEGNLAGSPAVGSPNVLAMLNGEELVIEEPPAPLPALQVGEAAPDFSLPNLDGETVSLSDFADRDSVVLFWSPGCVYCQRMVDDLLAWEKEPPENAPNLIIVSRGDLDANRATGLTSPMLIDDAYDTGRAYGSTGTPSGLLVKADGTVGSELVVGGGKVLALAGYVSADCKECLENCKQQGGGDACMMVCQMGGQCQ